VFAVRGPQSLSGRAWSTLRALLLLAAICAFGLAGAVSAATIVGTSKADVLKGSKKGDVLHGLVGDDRLYGYRGSDRLIGGRGDDVIVGGAARDHLDGGPGDDRIFARDGMIDRVVCGPGDDTVVADRQDRVRFDCEEGRPGDPPIAPPPPPTGGTIIREDENWTCMGPVDLALVKVTIRTADEDAIHLREGCTGSIDRIEVETWMGDGVKINAPEPVAHDLVIGGGYIRCFAQGPGGHQDGVQAMAGERITFRNVEINCNSEPNAQFYPSALRDNPPTDVVCENCLLGSGAAQTLFIDESVRSGARNSLICPGRFRAKRIGDRAQDPVDEGNRILSATDRRCQPRQ
jgi:Ca2+-binding RTX toxin-like protein